MPGAAWSATAVIASGLGRPACQLAASYCARLHGVVQWHPADNSGIAAIPQAGWRRERCSTTGPCITFGWQVGRAGDVYVGLYQEQHWLLRAAWCPGLSCGLDATLLCCNRWTHACCCSHAPRAASQRNVAERQATLLEAGARPGSWPAALARCCSVWRQLRCHPGQSCCLLMREKNAAVHVHRLRWHVYLLTPTGLPHVLPNRQAAGGRGRSRGGPGPLDAGCPSGAAQRAAQAAGLTAGAAAGGAAAPLWR